MRNGNPASPAVVLVGNSVWCVLVYLPRGLEGVLNFESGTPKVFHHRAQGREERATLGLGSKGGSTLKEWKHNTSLAISRCNSVGVGTLSPEFPG
jgi:hypothetical protein